MEQSTWGHIQNFFFVALSCVIFAVFLNLTRYALPKTDDFANMMYGYKSLEETGSILRTTWDMTVQSYTQQQGTYTAAASAIFLLVKCGTNLLRYQKIIAVFVALTFVSYGLLVWALARHFQLRHVWGVILFSALWVAVDLVGPGEPMLYIVGACVYCLPMSLGFLATVCYLRLMESAGRPAIICWSVLASGLAFLATGGVLMVAGMVNIFFVWIVILIWYERRHFPLRGVIPFFFAFGGALLNTLAPGNFTRYADNYGVGRPDFKSAFIYTGVITLEHLVHLLTQTYFLVALLIVAVVVLFSRVELPANCFRLNPIFLVIATYISCYVIIYPTVLGYNLLPRQFVEERICFTFAWIAALLLFLTWTYFLVWVKTGFFTESWTHRTAVIVTTVAIFLGVAGNLLYVPRFRADGSAPTLTTMYREYRSGNLAYYYASYHLALLGAEAQPVSGLYYIFYEIPENKLFMGNSMSADPEWWVNRTAAAVSQLALFDY